MTQMLIEVRGLTAGYGNNTVVRNLGFGVRPGRITALLGHNGAGKTTTLKSLIGLLPGATGEIRLNGINLTGLPVHKRIEAGLRMLPEGRGVFAQLEVGENLEIVANRNCGPGATVTLQEVLDLFPILQERWSVPAGRMSGGQQQMLAFGLALLGSPKCLLLDEPSIGLAPNLVERLFEQVRTVCRAHEIGAVLVEQNVAASLKVADDVIIMNNGDLVFEGTAAEARDSDFWQYF